jgi:hypothetical protein
MHVGSAYRLGEHCKYLAGYIEGGGVSSPCQYIGYFAGRNFRIINMFVFHPVMPRYRVPASILALAPNFNY